MNCCHPTSDVASRPRLRSSSRHHLVVPRHRRSTLGRRAFSVALRWPGTRCLTTSETVAQCRQFQEEAKNASLSECTWTLSALEALRNALYKLKTYLLTYFPISSDSFSSFRWPVDIPDSEELTGKGHFSVSFTINTAFYRLHFFTVKLRFPRLIPTFFRVGIPLFLSLP